MCVGAQLVNTAQENLGHPKSGRGVQLLQWRGVGGGEGWQQLAPGQPRAFPCSLLADFREKECLVWVVILFGLVCVKDESKRRGVPL